MLRGGQPGGKTLTHCEASQTKENKKIELFRCSGRTVEKAKERINMNPYCKSASLGNQAAPTRENISSQLLTMIKEVAERADAIAERTQNKLTPIQFPVPTCEVSKVNDVQQWPPLFNELRGYLLSIDTALTHIDDLVSRAEI